jgi:hypothetical protein
VYACGQAVLAFCASVEQKAAEERRDRCTGFEAAVTAAVGLG